MKPKKRLGQHFLTAPSYAEKIAAAVSAGPDDYVLEIGPGKGALSMFLHKRFPCFHCIEFDPDVVAALKEKLGNGDWVLHRGDVLEFDYSTVGFPLHVVGNLPYSIGARIIKKTLLYGNNIVSSTFMLQREVALRIVAKPHCRQNGFLSIFCQFFGIPKILFHVPAAAFFPKPKVDSSVVRIMISNDLERKLPRDQWENFFAFVDKGFRMRRKTLANALGRDGGKRDFARLLIDLNINSSARAEDLDSDQWLAFYRKSRLP